MALLVALWAAFTGACVGSFLNVVVARVPAGLSIVRPRSRCPRCLTPIRASDNIPVLSWLLLRGRCRACRAPIAMRYPLVEVAGAAIALVVLWRHGFTPAALAEFAFVALLLALALIDLDTWLLPNALTFPLIALGLAASALGLTPAGGFRGSLYGAGIGFAAFALVAWAGGKVFKKEALGFGDVWLLAGLGAWVGPMSLLPVVLIASVEGAGVGIALIALGKAQPGPEEGAAARKNPAHPERSEAESKGRAAPAGEEDWVPPKNAVPFGPFLALGAVEWLWFSPLLERLFPVVGLFR